MPVFPPELAECIGFDWDAGNATKNWRRHRVTQTECEQVLLSAFALVTPDLRHSERENRFAALGRTDAGRDLLVVFTIRGSLLRVISARQMSRRERVIYAKAQSRIQSP